MTLKRGPELDLIVEEAKRLAAVRSERATTAHLLLAVLAEKSTAGVLLRSLELKKGKLFSAMRAVGGEPAGLVDRAAERAQMVARRAPGFSSGPAGERSGGLHLLAALGRQEESAAYRCLVEVGFDPGAVANAALACLSGGGHKALSGAAKRIDDTRLSKASVSRRGQLGGSEKATASPGGEDQPRAGATSPRARTKSRGSTSAAKEPPSERPKSRAAASGRSRSSSSRRGSAPAPGSRSARRSAPRARSKDLSSLHEPWPAPAPRARADVEGRATEQPTISDHLQRLPLLGRIGRDLSEAARSGQIDPLIGRSGEIERIVDVLNRRRGNVPCLVGEPGVGKTAIVEGLALRLEDVEITGLDGRILVTINVGDLLAGTGVRGALSERLAALRAEVSSLEGRVIVFLDEVHSLLAATGGEAGEGAQELRAAMTSGSFPCILATTPDAFRKHVEQDPGLARRLTRIDVEEPEIEESIEIVRGASKRYAEHHSAAFDAGAIEAAVRLTERYMSERRLPDKALAVLDLAGARARRNGADHVRREEVAGVVADMTGVPFDRLAATDSERLLALEAAIGERIVGHEENISRVAEALRRNAAGLGGRRPVGSFLFLGPTGVGKTETARALAEYLFPGGGGMSRFDMSELSEPHSVARLVGAPPGYVGHEAGGHLTEAVRARPYQVVLLDEVEKAHPKVLMLLLQVLEDGRLTDGRGRLVDFTNAIVAMTSNLGVGAASRGVVGFGTRADDDGPSRATVEAARAALPPELWNRFDEVLYFEALARKQVEEVARRILRQTAARLARERGVEISVDDSVVDFLLANGGYDPAHGARPMRRAVQRLVESRLAEAVLSGKAGEGTPLRVFSDGTSVTVEKKRRRKRRARSRDWERAAS